MSRDNNIVTLQIQNDERPTENSIGGNGKQNCKLNQFYERKKAKAIETGFNNI